MKNPPQVTSNLQSSVTTTLIDTHAHLSLDSFAAEARVTAIICVSETLTEAKEVLTL